MKDDSAQDGAKPRAERILAALTSIEIQSGKTQGAMNCIWARIDDLECKFGDRFTFIEEQLAFIAQLVACSSTCGDCSGDPKVIEAPQFVFKQVPLDSSSWTSPAGLLPCGPPVLTGEEGGKEVREKDEEVATIVDIAPVNDAAVTWAPVREPLVSVSTAGAQCRTADARLDISKLHGEWVDAQGCHCRVADGKCHFGSTALGRSYPLAVCNGALCMNDWRVTNTYDGKVQWTLEKGEVVQTTTWERIVVGAPVNKRKLDKDVSAHSEIHPSGSSKVSWRTRMLAWHGGAYEASCEWTLFFVFISLSTCIPYLAWWRFM